MGMLSKLLSREDDVAGNGRAIKVGATLAHVIEALAAHDEDRAMDTLPLARASMSAFAPDPAWDTMLHRAAQARMPRLCSELIRLGMDPNREDETRRRATPLHEACIAGCPRTAAALLDAGANVNAKRADRATPLMLAGSEPGLVKLLIARGAQLPPLRKSLPA